MTDDTLDPPGMIAIIGGGPIGIEAALYGRYLGYSVILFEADRLVRRLLDAPDRTPPPICTSPLGLAAVAAQRGLGGTSVELELATYDQWAHEYFERIAESDLLAGRVRTSTRVDRLEWAAEEDPTTATAAGQEAGAATPDQEDDAGQEDEDGGPVPPDFLLYFTAADGSGGCERVEAVFDARGAAAPWIGPGDAKGDSGLASGLALGGGPTQPYLYRVGCRAHAETDFHSGLIQIRQLFATLRGRPNLDVYANLGGQI